MPRAARIVLAVLLLASVAACGDAGSGGATNGPGSSLSAAATVMRNVAVSETSDQTTTYLLAKGQYKLGWTTTNCPNIDLVVTQKDGTFTFEKKSTTTFGSTIIPSMPDGTYTLEQKAPGCTTFKVTFDRIG